MPSTHAPRSRRTVSVGGLSKEFLLSRLQGAGTRLNDAARTLFADSRFTTHPASALVEIVEVSPAELGFHSGATFAALVARAASEGLVLCPLELGPHLRLQFTDQAEGFLGQPPSEHRAPPGSITVASAPLAEDDDVPKGFYLRCMEGVLWLRGYRSWPGHHWSAEDVFVFARPGNAD